MAHRLAEIDPYPTGSPDKNHPTWQSFTDDGFAEEAGPNRGARTIQKLSRVLQPNTSSVGLSPIQL